LFIRYADVFRRSLPERGGWSMWWSWSPPAAGYAWHLKARRWIGPACCTLGGKPPDDPEHAPDARMGGCRGGRFP
jgi:hypothetical protein